MDPGKAANKIKVDITVVSGRRPELLERTLSSFADLVFPNFEPGRAIVNIDPFCGTNEDTERCVEIAHRYLPDPTVLVQETASFGASVKRLWMATSAPFVLHLEDDWIALENIEPRSVFPLFEGQTRMVSLMCTSKNWNGRDRYHCRRKRITFFYLSRHPDPKRPVFTTSPSFIEGEFARRCGMLMNPDLDPEKQFHNKRNHALQSYASGYANRFLIGRKRPMVIADIGRDWRDAQRIEKRIIDGRSIWVEQVAERSSAGSSRQNAR